MSVHWAVPSIDCLCLTASGLQSDPLPPLLQNQQAAERCVTTGAADVSKQPNAAEALAPPSQPGFFLSLSVWGFF